MDTEETTTTPAHVEHPVDMPPPAEKAAPIELDISKLVSFEIAELEEASGVSIFQFDDITTANQVKKRIAVYWMAKRRLDEPRLTLEQAGRRPWAEVANVEVVGQVDNDVNPTDAATS